MLLCPRAETGEGALRPPCRPASPAGGAAVRRDEMAGKFDVGRLLGAAAQMRAQGAPRMPDGTVYTVDMAASDRARAAYMEAGTDAFQAGLVAAGACEPDPDSETGCLAWCEIYDGLAAVFERLAELEARR